MTYQADPKTIRWQIHLSSAPGKVYDLISTNDGRALFWAESAMELEKHIQFVFPDGKIWRGKILEAKMGERFQVNYAGNTTVTFSLQSDGKTGTVLTLTDEGIKPEDRAEIAAGWVSVLLALKAAVDFGIDLRSHDAKYTWAKGFAEN